MTPDFSDLSGLNDPTKMAPDAEPQATEDTPDTATILDEICKEIAKMVNDAVSDGYSENQQSELAWFCGEKMRKVMGGLLATGQGPEALKALSKILSEMTSNQLTHEKLIDYMVFAETFPDIQIVSRLCEKLNLKHFLMISQLPSDIQRVYYSEMSYNEAWNSDTLADKIAAKTFESEYGEA